MTKGQQDRYERDCSAPYEIYYEVLAAKRSGRTVDDDLFRKVGSKFNLSSTETKKHYAAARAVISGTIYNLVTHAAERGVAINDDLFREVMLEMEMGLSSTETKELYDKWPTIDARHRARRSR